MAFEIELKFLGADFSALRRTIRLSGGVCKGAHFERNLVFDTPQRTFKDEDKLLRLRLKCWADNQVAVMTFKRPPMNETGIPDDVKVYDEQETVVANFESTKGILEALGYDAAFRYDKMREEWSLNGVEICLDTLPFGDVVEIEGPRDEILQTAEKLGLSMEQSHTGTYHDLNREYRIQHGLTPDDNFAFDDTTANKLMTNLEPCSTAGQ